MGSKGHFERIGSNLVTLLYLLQTVDTPFHNSLTSLRSQLYIGSCYSLLSVPVRRNDAKSKHEESHEAKEKGEELKCGLGRGALSLPVPEGFFSLTLASPVLIVPTTVEPLHWDTSIQGTPSFKGHKNLVPEKCSHNLCNCYLY